MDRSASSWEENWSRDSGDVESELSSRFGPQSILQLNEVLSNFQRQTIR